MRGGGDELKKHPVVWYDIILYGLATKPYDTIPYHSHALVINLDHLESLQTEILESAQLKKLNWPPEVYLSSAKISE